MFWQLGILPIIRLVHGCVTLCLTALKPTDAVCWRISESPQLLFHFTYGGAGCEQCTSFFFSLCDLSSTLYLLRSVKKKEQKQMNKQNNKNKKIPSSAVSQLKDPGLTAPRTNSTSVAVCTLSYNTCVAQCVGVRSRVDTIGRCCDMQQKLKNLKT